MSLPSGQISYCAPDICAWLWTFRGLLENTGLACITGDALRCLGMAGNKWQIL
jgi:hypothetical protein